MLAPLGALADDPGCEESEPGMMAASIAHAMRRREDGHDQLSLRDHGEAQRLVRTRPTGGDVEPTLRARKFSILFVHHGFMDRRVESTQVQLISLNQ